MINTTLVTNVELIDYAIHMGYDYNIACDIIESKELMLHVWELGSENYYIEDFDGSKFNDNWRCYNINRICGGFMRDNNLKLMTLVNEL
jgi:hypothetical protein